MERNGTRAVLGPFWTHWGFRYWRLLLYDDAIVAWPYTLWESLGVAWRTMTWRDALDPSLLRRDLPRGGDAKRWYGIPLLKKVEMVSGHMRNRLVLTRRSGERHTYVLPLREHTDLCRRKLRELYPGVYAERGFPGTWLGKLLKK